MTGTVEVLIVEDDASKRERIGKILGDGGEAGIRIEFAGDLQTARRILAARYFDLMILDLSLPARLDESPQPDGGVQLLDDLAGPRPLLQPAYIVGLTSYPELFEQAYSRFAQSLYSLLPYSTTDDDWADRLQTLIQHILKAKAAAEAATREYKTFVAIICALDSPELRAIRELPWGWSQERVEFDDTIYFFGKVTGNQHSESVVAAAARNMGVAASAVLAAKMIELFRPRYLAMTGIAAAVSRDDANYGDVLVADPCWEWMSGKLSGGRAGTRFLAAPRQLQMHSATRNLLVRFSEDRAVLERIRSEWRGVAPDRPLALRIGPIATGSALVADVSVVSRIQEQHRKVLGIDMEAYAVFSAADESREPRPSPFVLKGVVDYADDKKDDTYHPYAAYTSAQCLKEFVERHLMA